MSAETKELENHWSKTTIDIGQYASDCVCTKNAACHSKIKFKKK